VINTRKTHVSHASHTWLIIIKKKQHSLHYRQHNIFFCKCMNWPLLPWLPHTCFLRPCRELSLTFCVWKSCRSAQTIKKCKVLIYHFKLQINQIKELMKLHLLRKEWQLLQIIQDYELYNMELTRFYCTWSCINNTDIFFCVIQLN
jgi:hypothetical protein